MQKGEIWIVKIPELRGHEQSGLRPAIIAADTQSNIALIIPCTSNLQALRLPYTIRINPSAKNGLETASIALILQLRAIDKRRLSHKIGVIEKTILNQIDQKLKSLLAL